MKEIAVLELGVPRGGIAQAAWHSLGVEVVDGIEARLLGQAGQAHAERRVRGCARPVRLRGSTSAVNVSTGEVRQVYSSDLELDGSTYVPCGDRRSSACPPCSHRYKGDAWQILASGLKGGKGIPARVADRPTTFLTLTAPSFGAVHGVRRKGVCRPRREKPVCPHGRPLWCSLRHTESDGCVGEPLCVECYDYEAHVVWQFHANELWRRFLIALHRRLAALCGLSSREFRQRCRVSFSKVVEFQARGAVHIRAPIRLDGPEGSDGPATDLPLTVSDLEHAVHDAAGRVVLTSAPLLDGTVYELRWGSQVDTRTVSEGADREGRGLGGVHPEQVASYLAKYLTKTTEDFGISGTVRSAAHAAANGASPHAIRLIEVAEVIGRSTPGYKKLVRHLGTLGYRGHPISKSRAYSVTFGQLRRARRQFRRDPAGVPPDVDVRRLLDEEVPEGFELVSSWVFDGVGYLDLDASARAVRAACRSRTRRSRNDPITSHSLGKELRT